MSAMLPPKSYTGNGPFVFVSYSHQNAERVYPDIAALQQAGISVWYDEGLTPGEPWYRSVQEHLCMNSCVGTIFFTSDEFVRSESCRKEMGYIHQYDTPYFAVNLLDISPFDHAKKLYKTDQLAEDEETADALYSCIKDLFHKDITYIPYRSAKRIEDAVKTIREKWGYDDATEVFPCCNVLHNGHIVYFPTLMELTPFNFTYFVASSQQKVAETLNALHSDRHKWREYPLELFRTSDISHDRHIIVTIQPQQLQHIHGILARRRQMACAAQLIVNVWSADAENARKALEQVRPAIVQWRQENANLQSSEDMEAYFLCQTARKTIRQIQPADEVMTLPGGLERWRVLLSDSAYYSAAVSLPGSLSQQQVIRWLLAQQPLSDDLCFEDERLCLESDPVLLENYDREAFQQYRFDWEGD